METFWKDRKVLITGGTGFVGKHLVKALRDLSADVKSFGGDISSYYDVDRAVKGADTVYHLAARSIVEAGEENPYDTYKTNVVGTLNVLESVRKNNVGRIIVASTSHVYGDNPSIPYLETYALRPSRPYETSKSCADMIAQSYRFSYGLPVIIARFVNTYGPGDLNFSRVVPLVIKYILEGKDIGIYGGNSVREYLYVEDAISAYVALGKMDIDDKENVFNFGSGYVINVLDLAKLILNVSKVTGLKIIVTEDKRKGEVIEQKVSSQKALDLLNWKPAYSLEEGLEETYKWYKSFLAESN